MLSPWLGHGLLGDLPLCRFICGGKVLGAPGSLCACGMAGRETLPTWFCRVANGTWGRSMCTLEGCGPMFSSRVSALYHTPGEMLCSLLNCITATSTSANGYSILF